MEIKHCIATSTKKIKSHLKFPQQLIFRSESNIKICSFQPCNGYKFQNKTHRNVKRKRKRNSKKVNGRYHNFRGF